VKDGIRVLHILVEHVYGLKGRQHQQLDTPALGFAPYLFHDGQLSVSAAADNKLSAVPRKSFLRGQRRVTELVAEFLGRLLLAFANFALINDDVMLVCLAVYLNGPEGEFFKTYTGSLDRTSQALFLDVTAENADQRCSTFLPPQNGQAVFSLSCSVIVRILENVFLQPLQKNS
jgi:hypothetical protein